MKKTIFKDHQSSRYQMMKDYLVSFPFRFTNTVKSCLRKPKEDSHRTLR